MTIVVSFAFGSRRHTLRLESTPCFSAANAQKYRERNETVMGWQGWYIHAILPLRPRASFFAGFWQTVPMLGGVIGDQYPRDVEMPEILGTGRGPRRGRRPGVHRKGLEAHRPTLRDHADHRAKLTASRGSTEFGKAWRGDADNCAAVAGAGHVHLELTPVASAYLAMVGMVLNAPVALKLRPSTLIRPGVGVVSSRVPRRCAVTDPYRSARVKDLWAIGGSVTVSDNMTAPASLLMEIVAVTAFAGVFSRALSRGGTVGM